MQIVCMLFQLPLYVCWTFGRFAEMVTQGAQNVQGTAQKALPPWQGSTGFQEYGVASLKKRSGSWEPAALGLREGINSSHQFCARFDARLAALGMLAHTYRQVWRCAGATASALWCATASGPGDSAWQCRTNLLNTGASVYD